MASAVVATRPRIGGRAGGWKLRDGRGESGLVGSCERLEGGENGGFGGGAVDSLGGVVEELVEQRRGGGDGVVGVGVLAGEVEFPRAGADGLELPGGAVVAVEEKGWVGWGWAALGA